MMMMERITKMPAQSEFRITGPKVFAFTASAFALIIGVNMLMAYKAISTFPGLEVSSSYVASQTFDAERAAQNALGWRLVQGYDPALGQLSLRFTDSVGAPVQLADVQVLVGRSTEARQDFSPSFVFDQGAYLADAKLGQGKWVLHITGHAQDGTLFRQRLALWVKG
jgi:nitrogen fixation protein FixH